MGIRIGPLDPIQLIFEIMNSLLRKGIITEKEGKEMIKSALDPELSEEKKEKFIDSLIMKEDDKK